MELEQPFIAAMSGTVFEEVKHLLSTASDILWVTAGDHPSHYAIHGMARSICKEDADVSIRTLQLGNNIRSQDDASVETIIKVTTANTKDSEFPANEHGIVQMSRISADPALSDWASGREFHVKKSSPLGQDGIARRLEIGELGRAGHAPLYGC